MDALPDFDQLQLRFVDQVQWRYDLIRPVILLENRTAAQRAEETHPHPETVRRIARRFQQQGTLGLWPEHTEISTPSRGKPVPDAVVEELARLKALYTGFGYRELARILLHKTHYRHDDRYQARLQVVKLYYQGWSKRSISHYMQVSHPTVDLWIRRFEAEHFAGLEDKSRVPHTTPRQVWLPLMIEIYHLQKRHPDAGEFRIWSLLANDTIAVRTVGWVMALNKQVYDDIPHVPEQQAKK